jgi:RNA polymerase sigma-70 factor (ECF subfamily)
MTPKQESKRKAILTVAHHDYEKGLNLHAFFKVRDRATSEDLVQETFLKTWSYLVKGGNIDVMRAFLYHVLNNLIVDHYRKHKAISLDILLEKGFEPGIVRNEHFISALDEKVVILLIKDLSDKYRAIMRMRYVQELSLKEISLITGQSKNTVAVQVHRGLKKLRSLYESSQGAA